MKFYEVKNYSDEEDGSNSPKKKILFSRIASHLRGISVGKYSSKLYH